MKTGISVEQRLEERVKELTCLYNVSSAIRKHSDSVTSTLTEICQITGQAWLYHEDAIVELKLKDYHITTATIPTQTVTQQSNIVIFGEESGALIVHYNAEKYQKAHFLKEEQKLLNKLAIEISEFFERLEAHHKEEHLKRIAERNDRLSILGEITAGIAHELNTPLGNILGFAELIASKSENPQIKKDASKIIKSAIFSREVVKKLMFFACEMPQDKKAIQIQPVILQALALLGPNFEKANVNHKFHIDNPKLEAQLDSIQFTQVLFNLLINAIYVSPPKSTISITVTSNEKSFCLEIADEGPGISSELKAKIFEPFFTTKPIGEGAGLGLSVVHGIIKSHKGEIAIFDNENAGAIFQIQLPLKF
ncbi:HAMP domain-containing sensor histidine kinase [Salegentibacter sp. F188]|uniref:histidine kinase n=1 Tax=Autumnicola patrickiae TaxID=3075591 RepID=A0ABU3DYM7_9FLAO|nr:HAMP domain-containing sensor histidine kinase [Salegentibacter sp. F188]MDT0688802.1 HAMP domain-containing sensor histidine kinase [Salegentibacter sp. F188]